MHTYIQVVVVPARGAPAQVALLLLCERATVAACSDNNAPTTNSRHPHLFTYLTFCAGTASLSAAQSKSVSQPHHRRPPTVPRRRRLGVVPTNSRIEAQKVDDAAAAAAAGDKN